MKTERPFKRSYWPDPGKLLAGCFPGDRDSEMRRVKLEGLVGARVTLVVNLMEAGEVNIAGQSFEDYFPTLRDYAARQNRTIRMVRLPIRDMSVATKEQMRKILEVIHAEIAAGGVVYVHCWGGRGRTGMVVGCYMVETGLATRDDVLDKIKRLTDHAAENFQPTPQTPEQRLFVTEWIPK